MAKAARRAKRLLDERRRMFDGLRELKQKGRKRPGSLQKGKGRAPGSPK